MVIEKMKKNCEMIFLKVKNRRKNVHFPMNSYIDKETVFEGNNTVGSYSQLIKSTIGKGSYLGQNCSIYKTKIGRYCSIGNNVHIIAGNHPTNELITTYPAFYRKEFNGLSFGSSVSFEEYSYVDSEKKWCCYVGSDVWIGESASILNGVMIGDGAIIAAGAVVIDNVPPYAIVGGVPAKVLKYRFSHGDVNKLLKLKWWN